MRRRDLFCAFLAIPAAARTSTGSETPAAARISTGSEALADARVSLLSAVRTEPRPLGSVRLNAAGGTALLMKLADRRLLSVEDSEIARRWIAPPGSTIKPLSLLGLLEANKLTAADEYLCPGRLVLNGHSLTCSHPYTTTPMNVSRTIAYSCNCAAAHFAQRFEPGELATFLIRLGLSSPTALLPGPEAAGHIQSESAGAPSQLQALGEEGVEITPLELLRAYARLASQVTDQRLRPVLEGLEGAVEFGTAQGARLERTQVAGKTGTARTASGAPVAWFAGFAPSRAPQVVVTVLLQGRSGGADAAPIAGRLLREYFASKT